MSHVELAAPPSLSVRRHLATILGFVLLVLSGPVTAEDTAPELMDLPLATLSPYPIDQSIYLFRAPLPSSCRQTADTVTLCSSPLPLTLPIARYNKLRAAWGERKSPQPSRLNALAEFSPGTWTLLVDPSAEPPLTWWDPNHDGWLRVWPVLPVLSQVSSAFSNSLPSVIFDGPDTARIDLSAYSTDLVKWKVGWTTPFSLSIQPVRPSNPLRVLLDAGHGGDEAGADHDNLKEKDLNLRATLLLKEQLERRGAHVTLIRSEDRTVPLAERFGRIQSGEFDLALSIHHDWVSPALFPVRPACFFARWDLLGLARDLCAVISRTGGATVAPSRRHLLLTTGTPVPAILLEVLNFQDAGDAKILGDQKRYDKFLRTWAEGTAESVTRAGSRSRR